MMIFGAFEWLFLWLLISSRVYFHLDSSCSFIPIRLKVYFDRIVHDETTALFLNSYYYTGGNIYLPALIPFGSKSFRLILSRLNTVVPQYRTFNVNGTWLLTRSFWHLYRVSIHILARTFERELERPWTAFTSRSNHHRSVCRSKHIFNRKGSDWNSAGKASHCLSFGCFAFHGRISNGTPGS